MSHLNLWHVLIISQACAGSWSSVFFTCLSRYYEDVTPSDVAAILRNHARMEDIDVPALAAALAAEARGEATPAQRSQAAPSPAKKKAAAAAPLPPEQCAGMKPLGCHASFAVLLAGACCPELLCADCCTAPKQNANKSKMAKGNRGKKVLCCALRCLNLCLSCVRCSPMARHGVLLC